MGMKKPTHGGLVLCCLLRSNYSVHVASMAPSINNQQALGGPLASPQALLEATSRYRS